MGDSLNEMDAKLDKKTRAKLQVAFGEQIDDIHFDVIVEFFEEENRNCYRFKVYDNVSFVTEKEIAKSEEFMKLSSENESEKEGLNPFIQEDYDRLETIKKWKDANHPIKSVFYDQYKDDLNRWGIRWNADVPDPLQAVSNLYNHLVVKINNNFRQHIITDAGELKKGNWGLGEMKISAGYLQRKDIMQIGMGGDRITDDPVVQEEESREESGNGDVSDNNDKGFIIRATVSPLGTLAYEFRIPKPKEVGIVCKR